jgi:hypothetical protein
VRIIYMLPKEKLTWFRLNARVAKDYATCNYCKACLTKGRDGFGFGQCDNCLSKLCDELEAKRNPKPVKQSRYDELLKQNQVSFIA